ncbi:MAG: KilA-N domain-containing protein, partial [Bacteroidales bacterium]|nr:KilA-N domain-containing protein [Bacteroidales bacterium]
MSKNKKIEVVGQEISLYSINTEDYFSLTDMARYRDNERTNYIIQNWMRTRSAIEFCGLWEQLNNPNFKRIEFDAFKNESGANSFALTPQKWIETTGAIGIISKSGRYGGTFAHRDIAFEFATWISAEFKFYLINEFQRLKEEETNHQKLDWSLQRTLSKVNYAIHTDAIKERLIPEKLDAKQISIVYASEADLLNMALFGKTAADWR